MLGRQEHGCCCVHEILREYSACSRSRICVARRTRGGRDLEQGRGRTERRSYDLLRSHDARNQNGVDRRGDDSGGQRRSERQDQAVILGLCSLILLCGLSIGCSKSPQVVFDHALKTFQQGDLTRSRIEAERGYARYQRSDPEWAARFRDLEAESLLFGGHYSEALAALGRPPAPPKNRSSRINYLSLLGVAHIRLRQFPEAQQALSDAQGLCQQSPDDACWGVNRALGIMAKEQGQLEKSHQYFADNLNFARSRQQRFREANALLNQSAVSLLEEHFDEAADWSESAAQIAQEIGAADLEQNALGNLGWAYYKLGDPEKALDLFLKAGKRAAELDDVMDSASWKTNAGYVYLDAHNYTAAGEEFREAWNLAKSVNSKEDVYNALRALARLALQTHDLARAQDYSEQAQLLARETNNRIDELYLLLVKGQVAAGRGDTEGAEEQLDEVAQDSLCPVFLKWGAEHALARLYEARGDPDAADRQYRAAITTFEAARETIRHQDLQLSFFTNAVRIYDDYVRFLVA